MLEPLLILISPYTPHIAEELWSQMGHNGSICDASWPLFNEELVRESTFTCPISFNGKMRFTLDIPLDLPVAEVEKLVLADSNTLRLLNGITPKKVVVVPHKIVNIVV